MVWDEDSVPIPEGFPLTEPRVEITYIHHEVPEIPWNAIGRCMFSVNYVEFDGKAAETLLYLGPDFTERISPFGQQVTDIAHKFSWAPNYSRHDVDMGGNPIPRGWNYKLRWIPVVGAVPAHLEYKKVRVRLGTDVPHKVEDFSSLFRPDQ